MQHACINNDREDPSLVDPSPITVQNNQWLLKFVPPWLMGSYLVTHHPKICTYS